MKKHAHDWQPIEGRTAWYRCGDPMCRAIGKRNDTGGRIRTFSCLHKEKGRGPTCKAIAVHVDGDHGSYINIRCAEHEGEIKR